MHAFFKMFQKYIGQVCAVNLWTRFMQHFTKLIGKVFYKWFVELSENDTGLF